MDDVGVEEIIQQTPGISQTRFKTQISHFKHGRSSLKPALSHDELIMPCMESVWQFATFRFDETELKLYHFRSISL